MITFKYKIGYIHENFRTGEVIAQIRDFKKSDGTYYTKELKSIHAAKIFITHWMKGL
jgi:hypothetical protein